MEPLSRRSFFPGKPALAVLLSMISAFIVFSPALRAGFVWDDSKFYSYQGRDGEVEDNWPKWFFRPAFYALVNAEIAVNAVMVDPDTPQLDDRRAVLPHAVTLLLHVMVSGGVALFAARILRGRENAELGALAAGLMFAVHPVHAETASWCSAAADSLATLFLLASIYLGMKARDEGKPGLYAVAMLLFVGAMLSKEPAIAGVILIPLALWAAPPEYVTEEGRKRLPLFACVMGALAAAAVYWCLRYAFHRGTGALMPPDPWLAARQSLSAFSFYVKKLFYPWPQAPFIPVLPGKTEALAWSAAALAILFSIRLARRSDRKLYLFAFAWFLAACLPVLSVALKSVSHVLLAERYLYLPSVGFCLAFGFLAAGMSRFSVRMTYFMIGVVFTVSAPVSMYASTGWKDDMALWTRVKESSMAPDHPMPWMNLGRASFMEGLLDDAEGYFIKSLESRNLPDDPSKSYSHGYLALIMKKRAFDSYEAGDFPVAYELIVKAESHFKEALALLPKDEVTKISLEIIRYQKKNFEEALQNPAAARPLDPMEGNAGGNPGFPARQGSRGGR